MSASKAFDPSRVFQMLMEGYPIQWVADYFECSKEDVLSVWVVPRARPGREFVRDLVREGHARSVGESFDRLARLVDDMLAAAYDVAALEIVRGHERSAACGRLTEAVRRLEAEIGA